MVKTLHCDGGMIPPMVCVVECNIPFGKPVATYYRCVPKVSKETMSHHEVEYLAIIFALSICDPADDVRIITDSRLCIGHIDWGWKVSEKFKPYLGIIKEIEKEKGLWVIYDHVLRFYNPAGLRLEELQKYYKKHGTIRGWKFE